MNFSVASACWRAGCVVVSLGLFAPVSMSYGQGTVGFENSLSTLISTNSTPGGPQTGVMSGTFGSSYYFAMLAAPAGTTDPTAFSFTGGYATNNFIDGGLYGDLVTISNTLPGQSEAVLIWGWSANIGLEYSDLQAYISNPTFTAWYGQSQIATVVIGGDFPPPQIPFGSFPGQVPGFVLNMQIAPEPGALGILLIGAAALVFKQRVRRFLIR